MAIGFNTGLFDLLESEAEAILGGDPELLTRVVQTCVDEKIATVNAVLPHLAKLSNSIERAS